ncbi:MAG: hypothetical protein AAFV29_23840, partial [Myxococcota bacterium]
RRHAQEKLLQGQLPTPEPTSDFTKLNSVLVPLETTSDVDARMNSMDLDAVAAEGPSTDALAHAPPLRTNVPLSDDRPSTDLVQTAIDRPRPALPRVDKLQRNQDEITGSLPPAPSEDIESQLETIAESLQANMLGSHSVDLVSGPLPPAPGQGGVPASSLHEPPPVVGSDPLAGYDQRFTEGVDYSLSEPPPITGPLGEPVGVFSGDLDPLPPKQEAPKADVASSTDANPLASTLSSTGSEAPHSVDIIPSLPPMPLESNAPASYAPPVLGSEYLSEAHSPIPTLPALDIEHLSEPPSLSPPAETSLLNEPPSLRPSVDLPAAPPNEPPVVGPDQLYEPPSLSPPIPSSRPLPVGPDQPYQAPTTAPTSAHPPLPEHLTLGAPPPRS